MVLILVITFFSSCKKEKFITISGRLVLSSSNRVPVSNAQLEFYQRGSGGIGIPSSSGSSNLTARTNADGHFTAKFPLGQGQFIGIPFSSMMPINMSVSSNNIDASWQNLPASDTSLGEIYLYKLVRQLVVQVSSNTAILPSDTLILNASTTSGRFSKQYTNLSIPATTLTVLDTIPNVVFSYFDGHDKTYASPLYIRVLSKGSGSSFERFPMQDEQIRLHRIYIY